MGACFNDWPEREGERGSPRGAEWVNESLIRIRQGPKQCASDSEEQAGTSTDRHRQAHTYMHRTIRNCCNPSPASPNHLGTL